MKPIVLCLLTLVMSSQPHYAASGEAHPSHNKIPNVIALYAYSEADDHQNHARTADADTPQWYAALKRPEWWLVILGFPTLFFLGWQALETKRAARAARDGIILTHRPKLIIRGIALIPGTIVEVSGTRTVEDHVNWRIQYVVANTGRSTAYITEGNLTITRIDRIDGMLPAFPPYNDRTDSLGHFTVEPGEHKRAEVILDRDTDTMRFRILREIRAGGGGGQDDVYCLGFIQYRDKAKVSRRTAFCLRYDLRSDRFLRIENPDYDYAD